MKSPTENTATPQEPKGDGCKARLVRQLREAEERIGELKGDRYILVQDGERWREYGRSAIALRIKAADTLEEVDDQLSQIENTVHGMHMDAITKLRKFIAESLLSLRPNSFIERPVALSGDNRHDAYPDQNRHTQ